MSSIISKTKHLHDLSAIYETCRGQVSHRSQDLEIVQSKLEESRASLNNMAGILENFQLSLDLSTKTNQLDALKVTKDKAFGFAELVSQTALYTYVIQTNVMQFKYSLTFYVRMNSAVYVLAFSFQILKYSYTDSYI